MTKVRIACATNADRESIYGMRHQVYAAELGQHARNSAGKLTDALDGFNSYLVATAGDELLGFVSITPPDRGVYSIDKYFSRDQLPFSINSNTFEIRLLTVPAHKRGRLIAALLMYSAYRWVESHGGTDIVGIGRSELRNFYSKTGLHLHGLQVEAGAVTYELMSARTAQLRHNLDSNLPMLRKLEASVGWELDCSFIAEESRAEEPCFHGGAFFESVGDTFETLECSRDVVNADVLDAWFPPAPGVLYAIQEYLPWLLKTSPPVDAGGLACAIARARNLPTDSLVLGAGSSSLMFLALREWLTRDSRVLLPDPTYGEYAHIFENVIGCRLDRLALSASNGFAIDPSELIARLRNTQYDLVVLVNPNNPTGGLLTRRQLELLVSKVSSTTRIWIDEAYIDYAAAANPWRERRRTATTWWSASRFRRSMR
jgi:hypothetical protein